MSDKIDQTIVSDLSDCLRAAIDDKETQQAIGKAVENIAYQTQLHIEYALKDELAPMLVSWVEEMATRAVESLLDGNENQMRRYLGCEKRSEDGSYIGWTGRSDSTYWGRQREIEEWHPVIHGRLFETGSVELRKKIVAAHRELLISERISDLEDQVRSLVAQYSKLKSEKEDLLRRL